MTRLGYQIPNFTYPGVADTDLFDRVAQQATEAEAAGFDRVFVMDHFYQLPMIGAPEEPMFEAYSLLSALAQHTDTVRLSALVTGNTYRNPALLAKSITALDHVSHGRATLGIGSGWFELEHDDLGFEFGTFTDRFEKLEEALQIILPMLRGERPSLDGARYTVREAINEPGPLSRIPVMIGGSGEKKTLRMVAQYADESNLTCETHEIPQKLDALAGHGERLGRDRSEIKVTKLMNVLVAPTMEQAEDDLQAMAEVKGLSAEVLELVKAMAVYGDPDAVGGKLAEAMDQGLDGLTVNLPFNGHVPGRITLLAEVARQAMGDA
jgi:F420-dependent oxidoreductase-like protein